MKDIPPKPPKPEISVVREGCAVWFAVGLIGLSVIGCTANQRAKNWGGEAEMELPAGEKLVNVTWKDAELWYLTRPMRADETPETYTFREQSSFGMLEGSVKISESEAQ